MFENLNNQLVQIKGEIRKKQKWERQLAGYEHELIQIEATIFHLQKKLAKEQSDVKKLERLSVTNLFVTLLGSKEDRLEKEKQEAVTAELKLDAATKSKTEIVDAINSLQVNLKQVINAELDYNRILETKERSIKGRNSSAANQLYELSEQEGDISAYLVELDEAIAAGNSVHQALVHAVNSLEKAKGWGTFDMLGGGMISGALKHSHVDDATDEIHHAQSRMRKFQKELMDINEEADMHVDISSLLKFADFFFDGLIADWMVQGRINDSLKQTMQQKDKIDNILSSLNEMVGEKEQELERTRLDRKMLIESI